MQKTKISYKGETIEVPDFHAKRLVAAGRATLPGKSGGTYMRRDMQASEPQREPVSAAAAPRTQPEDQKADDAPQAKAAKRTTRSSKGEGA